MNVSRASSRNRSVYPASPKQTWWSHPYHGWPSSPITQEDRSHDGRDFGKRWGSHSSFKVSSIDRSGYPIFTINHFNSPVTYSSEGFLEHNLDVLNPDFVSLLHGTSFRSSNAADGVGSVNPFLKGLFSGKPIATQAHLKDEGTVVSAQQAYACSIHTSRRHRQTHPNGL